MAPTSSLVTVMELPTYQHMSSRWNLESTILAWLSIPNETAPRTIPSYLEMFVLLSPNKSGRNKIEHSFSSNFNSNILNSNNFSAPNLRQQRFRRCRTFRSHRLLTLWNVCNKISEINSDISKLEDLAGCSYTHRYQVAVGFNQKKWSGLATKILNTKCGESWNDGCQVLIWSTIMTISEKFHLEV